MRWFLIAMIAVLVLAHRSEQAMSRANTFSIHGKYLGVSRANDLWLRTDLTKKYSWMRMHGTCCVKQIHVLKTGEIIGVGLDSKLYFKRNLYTAWTLLKKSCCVKDVSSYRLVFGKTTYLVYIGINRQGRIVMKAFLKAAPWVLLPQSKKLFKAVAGIKNAIYAVGLDSWIYKYGGGNQWVRLPRTCCVKDIHVVDDSTHSVYGVGTDNKLYFTRLADPAKIAWKFLGHQTCCVKSISRRIKVTPVKMIGAHTNRELYFKPTNTAPLAHVLASGIIISVVVLRNGYIIGIGTNYHMYYRSSIDDPKWKHIRSSCCVKSVAEMSNGNLLGVGLNHYVHIRNKMWGRWYQRLPNSAAVRSIATTRSGKLYGIGLNNKIYVKQGNVYSHWRGPLKHSCCMIDISFGSDGYLYGVGTNHRLYKKATKSLTSHWKKFTVHDHSFLSIDVR